MIRRALILCALFLASASLLAAPAILCNPSDPVVPHRVAFYDRSANSADFAGNPNAIIGQTDYQTLEANYGRAPSPALDKCVGTPGSYSAPTPMTGPELAAIAAAEAAAAAAAAEAEANALAAQVRAGDGSTVVFRGTAFILANSTAETDLLNATIPAGLLETKRVVRITLAGDRLNSSGATEAAPTLRVRLNGVVAFADPMAALATNAARSPWRAEILIATVNATNLVAIDGIWYSATAGGATTGIGNLAADATTVPFAAATPVSFDTTNPLPVRVTIQLGTANANVDLRLHISVVELL